MTIITGQEKKECTRCGACCRKGGPTLHPQDKDLLGTRLLAEDLCTIRAGELVRDDALGKLLPLPQELVKVGPVAGARAYDWTCRFLGEQNVCALYGQHPAECRAFFCGNTAELEALAGQERLDRAKVCGLLQAPAWWPELIAAHEAACSYAALSTLAPVLDEDQAARQAFLEIVEQDRAYRELAVAKAQVPQGALCFLFGRPLLETMTMYGLKATQRGEHINIVRERPLG